MRLAERQASVDIPLEPMLYSALRNLEPVAQPHSWLCRKGRILEIDLTCLGDTQGADVACPPPNCPRAEAIKAVHKPSFKPN